MLDNEEAWFFIMLGLVFITAIIMVSVVSIEKEKTEQLTIQLQIKQPSLTSTE